MSHPGTAFPSSVPVTLGQRVRQLRGEAGLTLAALSTGAEISISFLADIEHDRTVPSLERLQRIAEAFALDARGLLEGVRRFGED